ncbi:EVE domain-containing protein [bacterium]|nr:EVE domain-containing protein [bacterium]
MRFDGLRRTAAAFERSAKCQVGAQGCAMSSTKFAPAENNETQEGARCWLLVAPLEQVRALQRAGICQAGNGGAELLRSMRGGDWLVYYSGYEGAQSRQPCRLFSAAGRVGDGEAGRWQLPDGRLVERRRVEYFEPAQMADILPLLPQLSLTAATSRRWGAVLSSPVMEISASDMALIVQAMGLEDVAAQICGAFAY